MQYFSFFGKLKFRIIDLLRGTSILPVLEELHQQQYLPAEELERIRQQKLDRLFALAKNKTAYYRQYADYSELPMLTKNIVRHQATAFAVEGNKKKLFKKTTGGSTGEPFSYYSTALSQSYVWAGLLLSWEAAGYRLGNRVAFIAGSSIIKSGWQYRLFYWLMNVELLYASPLNDEVMADYVQKLRQQKTAIIYGYANTIQTLAHYIIRMGGITFPHLKAVVSTAELLTPAARIIIEKAFGAKVFNQYGCNEAGISAFECEQGNMHLISTRCVYETAEDGCLLGTDLANEGYIMMKFNSTDLVQFGHSICACNRHFPIIQSMVGRQTDILVDMDNNIIHASFFGIVLDKDASIRQFQIAYSNDAIEINIHSDTDGLQTFTHRYLPMLRQHTIFKHYSIVLNAPFISNQNDKHKEVVDKRVKI